MPKRGLEPPRPYGHNVLSVARLPIPPLRLGSSVIGQEVGSFKPHTAGVRGAADVPEGRLIAWDATIDFFGPTIDAPDHGAGTGESLPAQPIGHASLRPP